MSSLSNLMQLPISSQDIWEHDASQVWTKDSGIIFLVVHPHLSFPASITNVPSFYEFIKLRKAHLGDSSDPQT